MTPHIKYEIIDAGNLTNERLRAECREFAADLKDLRLMGVFCLRIRGGLI